jgi:serine/threonine-protein kinase
LKVLLGGAFAGEDGKRRLHAEAAAAGRLQHPNIVAVHDAGVIDGQPFFSMTLVEGPTLADVIRAGALPATRAARYVARIAEAVHYAHTQGVLHRDLKPSNVLLGRGGEVKIADFGIALDGRAPSLTQTGHAIGTPRYMAPEQFLGERVDGRADLFTFGVLLYEMLAGEPPFEGADHPDEGLLRRIDAGRYRPVARRAPGTPRALSRLVKRCLRGKARRRLPSATALRRALERLLGSPSPADVRAEIAAWLWSHEVFDDEAGSTRAKPPPRRRRRALAPWLAAAACAAALLATAASTTWVSLARLPAVATLLELAQSR